MRPTNQRGEGREAVAEVTIERRGEKWVVRVSDGIRKAVEYDCSSEAMAQRLSSTFGRRGA